MFCPSVLFATLMLTLYSIIYMLTENPNTELSKDLQGTLHDTTFR